MNIFAFVGVLIKYVIKIIFFCIYFTFLTIRIIRRFQDYTWTHIDVLSTLDQKIYVNCE